MKTLEQIKNDYALSKGYLSWKSLLSTLSFNTDFICKYENEVMVLVQKECLKRASENAKTIKSGNSGSWYDASVNKESITNENNIIK